MYNESEARLPIPVQEDTLGSTGDLFSWTVAKKFLLTRISAFVTTVFGAMTTNGPTLAIKINGTEVATIAMVAASAVGTEVLSTASTGVNFPIDVAAGDVITFNVKTAAAGGATTGAVSYIVYQKEQP